MTRHDMGPISAQPWRTTVRNRLLVATVAFALWGAAIEARLVWLQVVRHDDLTARADSQRQRVAAVAARRGDLVDRHGRTLAMSVDADSIYAVPGQVTGAVESARAICAVLADCGPDERALFVRRLQQPRAFVYLRRQVGPDEARRVAALDLPGIGLEVESRRFYPNRELAAHVLGYVGLDNTGLAGLEQSYDSTVRGQAGTIRIEADARQRVFSRVERPTTAGATLELTIDVQLQHIVERELSRAVVDEEADGGTVVMADPATGEILALASYPTFNPNAFGSYPADVRRNRAVQEIYEPGSTFKVVTASAALEERVFTTDEVIDVGAGLVRIGSRVVEDVHRYGPLSFTDVIVKSSNVGAIAIGERLGAARLGAYARRFGFGQRVCGDLPGETPGLFADPGGWSTGALASISMGYEVGVTPLQMVAAFSAVANGGEWVPLRAVRATRTGTSRTETAQGQVRRVISADTASRLRTIMEQVVARGTGTLATVPGYTAAGKTGTASKVIDGSYSTTDYYASFVGFAPSSSPAFTILVVLDSPRRDTHRIYGGTVAAPVFSRIARPSLDYMRVPPDRPIERPAPRMAGVKAEQSSVGSSGGESPAGTVGQPGARSERPRLRPPDDC